RMARLFRIIVVEGKQQTVVRSPLQRDPAIDPLILGRLLVRAILLREPSEHGLAIIGVGPGLPLPRWCCRRRLIRAYRNTRQVDRTSLARRETIAHPAGDEHVVRL